MLPGNGTGELWPLSLWDCLGAASCRCSDGGEAPKRRTRPARHVVVLPTLAAETAVPADCAVGADCLENEPCVKAECVGVRSVIAFAPAGEKCSGLKPSVPPAFGERGCTC